MRRHDKLIPLSRFHRSCLFLALLAKKNAPAIKNYPTETKEKIDYAVSFYNGPLKSHFEKEAVLWQQVSNKSQTLEDIISELTIERNEIIRLFEELANTKNEAILHQLGILLEKHVRKEERVLFQQIQADLSEEQIKGLLF